MKTIRVAAAVIVKNRKVLAAQRGYGAYKDGWEFPGGKIEQGESSDAALIREIHEELDAEIVPQSLLAAVECDYEAFHLQMYCWLCHINNQPQMLEHEAFRWLSLKELYSVQWLKADQMILPQVEKVLRYEADM